VDIKATLFESGFEVFHDFLSENVRIQKALGFLQPLISEVENARRTESRLLSETTIGLIASSGIRRGLCQPSGWRIANLGAKSYST
jgi:hypothetical protein